MEVNKTVNTETDSFVIRETIRNSNDDTNKDIVSVCPSITIENFMYKVIRV